eukprot:jgi/Chrzof1/9216/Cz03g40080.t1
MSLLVETQQLADKLKLKVIQLPAVPPNFGNSATAKEELTVAREILEYAVLVSLKSRDEAALERSFIQLKTYYADTRSLLPPSSQEYPMIGLNLLRLLVQNRIAEFHTELELVPAEGLDNPYILQSIQLEQWLMEGAYNKVLSAKQQIPSEFHSFYMDQLTDTVRSACA